MPGYLYFALKCMQHKWPQKKKKKKKKKKNTTLRCCSFPHLHEKLWSRFTCFTILLFWYFPLVLLNLVLVIPLEIVEKEPKISILV